MTQRTIKFRGKSKNTDNQQIVYGWGCYTDQSQRAFIITDDPVPMTYVQVEEIQQFIGLSDKNGKEIYEGDIVKHEPDDAVMYEVGFEDGAFCLISDENGKEYDILPDPIEVIGNVWEHPTLLNGGK